MKTQIHNIFSNIIKEMGLEQHFIKCWAEAGCNKPDFNTWFENGLFLSLFTGMRYQTSIHEALNESKEAQCCYRILRNENYDFKSTLFEIGLQELEELLEKQSVMSLSWRSRNKLYLIIDESVLDRTTDGFDEIKSLPGHKYCHVPINLILVVGGKEYHIPIGQQFVPAERKSDSKVDLAVKMIDAVASRLKSKGYRLKGITVLGDREYLCDKMNRVCLTNEMTFECKGKRNTKLIDENNLEMQVKDWIEKEIKSGFKGFKQSCQLSSWCKEHKHQEILYKKKIFDTKVLGRVKAVMTVPLIYKNEDKID